MPMLFLTYMYSLWYHSGFRVLMLRWLMQECKSKDDDDNMLICDWCQKGVHLYCHKPALTEIPGDGDWYCHICAPIVEKQTVAKDILQRDEESMKAAGVSTSAKFSAMADLLAGVGVADDTTMCTGTMVSGAYACVTSPCKPAPGVKKDDATSKVCCMSPA